MSLTTKGMLEQIVHEESWQMPGQYVYRGCYSVLQALSILTIKYCPGEEMAVADTLSRYSPEDTPDDCS